MPYCEVGRRQANEIAVSVPSNANTAHGTEDEESVRIFYQRYGHGPTKVLFIIGLAGTHDSWGPQILGLCGTDKPHEAEDEAERGDRRGEDGCLVGSHGGSTRESVGGRSSADENNTREQSGNGIEVCAMDNRGVGKSSIPKLKSEYSTKTMAEDALAVLDHLGWDKAHVCGHSMGGMIACKLAAMVPHRLSSLTLIGVTGGGYQCFPKFNRTSISIAYRIFFAKTPEERSAVDLETHYTHDYLESTVGETNRRALLFTEYVKNIGGGGMQPRYGLEGQASACWNHSLSTEELETVQSAGIIVAVVHGRGDVIAQVEHARKLAKKLHPVSRMIELSGGHLVTHENTNEVNGVLLDVIRAVSMNIRCTEFKPSHVGLYATTGGEHWQTGDTRGERFLQNQRVAELESQTSWESADSVFWRKVLPDWKELLDIFPFLQWLSNLLGINKLWKKVSVY